MAASSATPRKGSRWWNLTSEHALIVVIFIFCLLAFLACLPLALKIRKQFLCRHNSVMTEMPQMEIYRDLFSGRLSIEEYRKIKIPPDKRTCCDCGKIL